MSFRNILVNTSANQAGSDANAVLTAERIACRDNASITVFDVSSDLSWIMQHISGGWEDTFESLTGSKRQRLARLAQMLRDHGHRAESVAAKGRLASAIIQQVRDGGHDLVIKSAERSSNRSGMMGSTDMRLIRQCPCAVLVLRPDDKIGFQKAAVAADVLDQQAQQQDLDRQGLGVAVRLAESSQPVSVLYALPKMKSAIHIDDENADVISDEQLARWDAELENAALGKLDALSGGMEQGEFACHVLFGDPVTAIPEFVNSHAIDLLVLGSVARQGIEGYWLGNTAERILEKVECSVIVLKPRDLSLESE